MKILYITYEGFDTPNAANQMAETMINAFLEQGHTVYLKGLWKYKFKKELNFLQKKAVLSKGVRLSTNILGNCEQKNGCLYR